MTDLKFILNGSTLNTIFPFYILLDENLLMKGFGNSLSKMMPCLKEGELFTSYFTIVRPTTQKVKPQNFTRVLNQLVVFTSKGFDVLTLRGQFEKQDNGFLFVGSPWFMSIEDIGKSNLLPSDFAHHDPLIEILQVLKNQENTNKGLKALNNTIEEQRKKLKCDKDELDRLALVASANKNGVVFTHLNGKIFWCNEAFSQLTGFMRNEIIGKSLIEIGSGKLSNIDEIYKMVEAFYSGKSFAVEYLHLQKGGSVFLAKISGQPILDLDNSISQYFAIVEDITLEKEINQKLIASESRLSSFIANLQSGVMLEDENGQVLLVNSKLCSFFDLTDEIELLKGTNAELLFEGAKQLLKNPSGFIERMALIIEQKEVIIAEEIELADGRVYERSFIPIFTGEKYNGHLWSYEDITIKKKHKESLIAEKEKYSTILANINMGLLEVDKNNMVQAGDQTMYNLNSFHAKKTKDEKATDSILNEINKEIPIIKSTEKTETIEANEFYVNIGNRLIKIDIPSITMVKANGDYIIIKTETNAYTVHTTLKNIEDKLPADLFLKVHRSYIINTNKIIDIEDYSVLIGKEVIPVSRGKRAELINRINLL